MGSARLTAAGAEAYLDKILDGDEPAVQADGPGPEAEDVGRVDPPQRQTPRQEPRQAPEPELPPEQEEPEVPEVEDEVKPARKPVPDEEETMELARRGQRVRLSKQRVVELAQKGWDYDAKMQDLKAHETELRKDAKGWESYQQYRDWMRRNQPAAQAVANLLNYFEEKGRVPKMDLEGEGEPGTEPTPPWAVKMMERQQALEERVEARERQRAQHEFALELMAAVRSQPVLKRLSDASLAKADPRTGLDPETGKKPVDRALQKLATAMQADPNADPYTVAEMVATDLSQDVETLNPAARTYVEDKVRDQKRFGRPGAPGAAAPAGPTAEPKEYSAKDLKDGTVRKGVKAFLDSISDQ